MAKLLKLGNVGGSINLDASAADAFQVGAIDDLAIGSPVNLAVGDSVSLEVDNQSGADVDLTFGATGSAPVTLTSGQKLYVGFIRAENVAVETFRVVV